MNPGQILAIAVGAYFVYEYFYGGGATDTETTDESGSDESGSGGNGSASSSPSVAAQIRALGEADGNAVGGKLNFWQWNHYYQQVTGKTGPDPFTFVDFAETSVVYVQTLKMNFDTWKSYMTSAGVGLGAVWGTDWYSARGRQAGVVSSQRANVMEGARKRFIN